MAMFPKPKLYGKLTDESGLLVAELRCGQETFTVGRNVGCDMVVRNRFISQYYATPSIDC